MRPLKSPLLLLTCSFLFACNQETVSDPANPKVNAVVSSKADYHVSVLSVDEKKKKITVKDEKTNKEMILIVDEKYYGISNFHQKDALNIWLDEHSTLTGENPVVLTNPLKIEWKNPK